jgi:4-hydroxy-3-methylbut-2-enyl diphosphate reductase
MNLLMQLKITVEEHAGFCFGVKRAIDLCYEAVKERNAGNIYTYGDIIHNTRVVNDLKEIGVFSIGHEDIKK